MPINQLNVSDSAKEGLIILTDTVTNNIRHQDYERVTNLATLYQQLISGKCVNDLLKQFVRREDEQMFAQRKRLTIAITQPVSAAIRKPFKKVSRVKPAVYKIDFQKDSEAKKVEVRSALDTFNGANSLERYMQKRFNNLSFTDPNAFIVTEFKNAEIGPRGEMLEKVKPYPFEVSCFEAINFLYENNVLKWLIVELPHKYEVARHGSDVELKDGHKYTIYLEKEAIVFEQIDVVPNIQKGEVVETNQGLVFLADENRCFLVQIYEHKRGRVPAIRVGYIGDLQTKERTCVNPMDDAVPYFMKTIKTVSELDLTMTLHAHPQKVQLISKCQGEAIESGVEACFDGKTPDGKTCKRCGGSGIAPISTTAQDAILVPKPKDTTDFIPIEGYVHYVSPPIDIAKFQKEYVDSLKQDAMHAIFNSEIYDKPKIAGTATEKLINLDSAYDTLTPFAEHYSEVMRSIISDVAAYLDHTDVIIEHEFPKDFKFKTVADLLAELQIATTSEAAGYIRQSLNRNIAEQLYIDQPNELKKVAIQEAFHPFPGKTSAEIMLIISQGLAPKKKEVLWSNFEGIFTELEMEQEISSPIWLYDLEPKKIKELLDKKLEEYMKEIETNIQPPATSFRDEEPPIE